MVIICSFLLELDSGTESNIDKTMYKCEQEVTLPQTIMRLRACGATVSQFFLSRNLVLKMPKERLFAEDSDNRLSSSQIKEMLSDAEYHLALCFMRRGEYEEAIKRFENLTNPWASYHAAQVKMMLASDSFFIKSRKINL